MGRRDSVTDLQLSLLIEQAVESCHLLNELIQAASSRESACNDKQLVLNNLSLVDESGVLNIFFFSLFSLLIFVLNVTEVRMQTFVVGRLQIAFQDAIKDRRLIVYGLINVCQFPFSLIFQFLNLKLYLENTRPYFIK